MANLDDKLLVTFAISPTYVEIFGLGSDYDNIKSSLRKNLEASLEGFHKLGSREGIHEVYYSEQRLEETGLYPTKVFVAATQVAIKGLVLEALQQNSSYALERFAQMHPQKANDLR